MVGDLVRHGRAHASEALEVVAFVGGEDEHDVWHTVLGLVQALLVCLGGGPFRVLDRDGQILVAVGPDHEEAGGRE